ncbi:MAG: sensor histidine kinase [Candidatus Kapabacteria bacterium]|nr:sensor histidine kinase [Candidatus Kapabacteria bacterium]
MKIQNKNKEITLNNLILEIQDISSRISNTNTGFDFINESLKIIIRYTKSLSAGFFVLDETNYDFILKRSLPANMHDFYISTFEILSEDGDIGNSLQNATYYQSHSESQDIYHLILPLISIKSVKGLVIISSNHDYSQSELFILKLLHYFSSYIAVFLENQYLSSQNQKTQVLLDQLIASRTIELVENNTQLGEKIENLKLNLSMSIPHEVRTPINEIMGMSNYLLNFLKSKKDDCDEDIEDIIIDIKNSAARLNNLFENFIYHTRLSVIATSMKDIQALHSQYSPYCESIIKEQAIIRSNKYSRLSDLDVHLVSAVIKIGEEYLAKIIDELVDNAFKFSKEGTKVSINSHIDGKMYVISIKDLGVGIPSDFLDQISSYTQFNRMKNEQQGLGLGLAIAYKIIDLHNGDIDIDSRLGEFTHVTIKLPIVTDFNPDFI